MLLDIDHVAFASSYVERDIEVLHALGYKEDFVEIDVENLNIKRDFLRVFSEYHDISLLKAKDNINIELTNHKNIHVCYPYIIPIFENLPHDMAEHYNDKESEHIGNEAKMKNFDVPVYLKHNQLTSQFKFNKMVICTNNILGSVNFFKILGFRLVDEKDGLVMLEFKSLFSDNVYELYLKKDDNNLIRYLDDSGPNCIALISNSLEVERKNLQNAGYYTTSIQRLALNRKLIDVFFTRGPSNEIIEIISIGKN